MVHQSCERETFQHDDGTWSGIVRCHCGWSFDITDQVSRPSAEVSLHGAWLHHSEVT